MASLVSLRETCWEFRYLDQEKNISPDYSKSSNRIQTGFLAQEVEQICNNLGYEFSGLHIPTNDTDNYGIAYASFVPIIVKAMQEQQSIIENLKEENASMKKSFQVQLDLLLKEVELMKKGN